MEWIDTEWACEEDSEKMGEKLEVKNISKNNDRFVYDVLENTSNVFRKLNTSDELFLTVCCNRTHEHTVWLLSANHLSFVLILFYFTWIAYNKKCAPAKQYNDQ